MLDVVKNLRRFAWVMLSQNAQVAALDGDVLTIALVNAGARESFHGSNLHEYLQKALQQVLGVTWRIETIVDPSAGAGSEPEPPAAAAPAPPPPAAPPAEPRPEGVPVPDSVREAMRQPAPTPEDVDAEARADDPVLDESDADIEEMLSRELGAKVIGDPDA